MPFYEFFSSQPLPSRHRSQLGDLDAVPCHPKRLAGFHLVHDGSRVVPELSLCDHLHELSVAPHSPGSYAGGYSQVSNVVVVRKCSRSARQGAGVVFSGSMAVYWPR